MGHRDLLVTHTIAQATPIRMLGYVTRSVRRLNGFVLVDKPEVIELAV